MWYVFYAFGCVFENTLLLKMYNNFKFGWMMDIFPLGGKNPVWYSDILSTYT